MRKAYILGLMVLGAMTLAANADIIPTLSSISASGSNFQWSYASNVTVDQNVTSGDFFTIYDFGGFVPGSATGPTGWTFTSSLSGITPGKVSPTDNPTIPNLTWTYSGPTIPGSAAIGTFSVLSTTNLVRTGDFAAQGTRNSGPDIGTKVNNVGTISVPVPEMSALAPMIGVCGLGMIGFATSMLRRRQVR